MEMSGTFVCTGLTHPPGERSDLSAVAGTPLPAPPRAPRPALALHPRSGTGTVSRPPSGRTLRNGRGLPQGGHVLLDFPAGRGSALWFLVLPYPPPPAHASEDRNSEDTELHLPPPGCVPSPWLAAVPWARVTLPIPSLFLRAPLWVLGRCPWGSFDLTVPGCG